MKHLDVTIAFLLMFSCILGCAPKIEPLEKAETNRRFDIVRHKNPSNNMWIYTDRENGNEFLVLGLSNPAIVPLTKK